MPVTATHLTSGYQASATNATTASISLSKAKLILVAVASVQGQLPTVSSSSRTWTQVDTHESGTVRVTLFRSLQNTDDSETLNIDFDGNNQIHIGWSITEFDNTKKTGVNGADAIVQSAAQDIVGSGGNYSLTLSAFEDAGNATFGFLRINNNTNFSPGSGFTELAEISQASFEMQSQWKNSADTTVDWTNSTTTTARGCAVEIRFSEEAFPETDNTANMFLSF